MADDVNDWVSPTAAAAPAGHGDHDDWVTPPPAHASPPEDKGGVGRNLVAGFTEGLTGIPRMLLEPGTRLMNAVEPFVPNNSAPENSTAYALGAGRKSIGPLDPNAPTHALNQGLGHIGLNPEDVTADSTGERIARFAGTGMTAALAPELAGEKLATEAPTLATRVASRAANTPIATTARKAATGALAGAGAGTAGEVVPNDMPVTKLIAQTAAPVLAGGAPEVAGAALDRTIAAIARFGRPMTAAGPEMEAADILRGRSQNPAGLLDSLDQDPHLVLNSHPTTGQATGDMGLLALEREQAAKNPQLFMQRRTEQNAARREALGNIQQGGDANAVGIFLRNQFRQFDDQAQQHVDALTAHAQQQAEQLGGAGLPEQHGTGIRDALQQAENAARTKERSLWKAVDPDNNIRVDASPTFQAARDIEGGMSRMAAPMEGPEKGIFDSLQGSKQLSLGELSDLRSRVSTAARKELIESGNSPSYARLIRLRGAIQNNLADAASGKVAEDAQAVARGEMPAADTISSKIQGWIHDYYGQRAAQSGATGGEGAEPRPLSGPTRPPGPDGAGFSPAGGPAGGASDPGIPPRPLDETDAARLADATQATKERAGIFNQGPIKQTLAKAGTQDVYKLPEAKVPDKFFHSGPTSPSDIRQLRSTIGDEPANRLLSDYAAASLRRAAENPDGTLDPRKVTAWRSRFSGAMGEFPELDQKFSTAAGASDAIADATASMRDAARARASTALGKVMQAQTGDDLTKTVGSLLTGAGGRQKMAELVRATAGNQDARQGLRQAVADHITKNLISNTEAGTSGTDLIKSDAFQSFVTKNRGPLSEVFNPVEMQTLDAIAADLKRANRSLTAVKLPGGSNTTQDLHGIIANNPQSSILDKIMANAVLTVAGKAVSGTIGGVIGFLGGNAINNARAAGLRSADDLVTEALLDPVLAKNLLRRAPARPDSPMAQPVSARLHRLGWATAAAMMGNH